MTLECSQEKKGGRLEHLVANVENKAMEGQPWNFLRFVVRWLFRACWIVVPFLLAQKIHESIETSEELQVALKHVSIASHHVFIVLAESATVWTREALSFWKTSLQPITDWANSPRGFATIRALVLLSLLGISGHIMKRWRSVSRRSTNVKYGGDDGMEILRTSRERTSTFDFFGTHTNVRERSSSLGELSRSELGDFRRERMGSMDLFYSQRNSLESSDRSKSKARESRNAIRKPRSLSSNGSVSQETEDQEELLFDEFGLVTVSYRVVYFGPMHTAISYDTWTPPTSWAEASRRILPQDIMLKLRRTLVLDMNHGTVTVKEPKSSGRWDFSKPVREFSVHVQPPVEGGVVSLYVKGTPKEQWMEHTFESAQQAAQFQLDLLAYQVIGKPVNDMFQVLSLLHLGSPACDVQEFVLHDDVAVKTEQGTRGPTVTGVAWDDAMRALSSIPTIRIALERAWLCYRRPADEAFPTRKKSTTNAQTEKGTEESNAGLLTEEYADKRLLLGPVDFFRLFVPALPDTALPHSDSNRSRMEQMLSWRKRVARAAVLIQAYAMSRRVVNLGWNLLDPASEPTQSLVRRLAFDDNEDNNRRDSYSKNEVYEASVSRDVLCHVRPFDYFSQSAATRAKDRRLVLSPYQAFAFVGAHVIKKPENAGPDFLLHPSRDPVEAMPSLQMLIAQNPDLDFFVQAYHRDNAVLVACYVRSLAKGIDPQFDNVISRFTEGDTEARDRKLHIMVQMGQNNTLSLLGYLFLRFLTYIFALTRKGRESPVSLQARRDRTPFPAIHVASFARTYHFGGAMQTNIDMPKNYLSLSLSFRPQSMPNIISRLLFSHIESQTPKQVLDFTMVLEGESEDELPERALLTLRMVRVDVSAIAQTASDRDVLSSHSTEIYPARFRVKQKSSPWSMRPVPRVTSMLASQPRIIDAENFTTTGSTHTPESGVVEDRLEMAVSELTRLLRGVKVSIRADALEQEFGFNSLSANETLPDGTILRPVLKTMTKRDIKRFILSTNYNMALAATRIVQTSAWRGRTFPVDIRRCRIELQSGQFFQQGRDLQGRPVFYFTAFCRGPWRHDVEATIAAAIHRFDTRLADLCSSNSDTRCTLVILLGQIHNTRKTPNAAPASSDEISEGAETTASTNGNESTELDLNDATSMESKSIISNPRLPVEEAWQLHSNKEVIYRLVGLLLSHYPERISRVLLVKGKGSRCICKRRGAVQSAVKNDVTTSEAQDKIKFISNSKRLKFYIADNELPSIAGGTAPLALSAFECY